MDGRQREKSIPGWAAGQTNNLAVLCHLYQKRFLVRPHVASTTDDTTVSETDSTGMVMVGRNGQGAPGYGRWDRESRGGGGAE